ncbi:unnamed protein product [Aphanomyces euteiches]|uniref:PX domain-containing protein n=1 Tax=Aphanomyces euteiches TaxID=100861 RepID=A0A6G0WX12_9STRA|nr:hypothetical protein Ae201684_010768 [Aphanomyces euteiches]KAH9061471.1 hypothetical protein Ae201684P_020807 [Aphanomyces euteiches]KAH9155001.1 hypothetical protein AeRB84_002990 [Aphanomyces euteiches]
MLLESVHVVRFDPSVEKGKKTVVYVTEVNSGKAKWEVEVRYSRFHEFHQELLKVDRKVMGKFPFPSKDLFANHSPEHRVEELDKFVVHLLDAYELLTPASQALFLELLEVAEHNVQEEERPENQADSKDDIPEKRVSKQSVSSSTTTELDEDNQRDSISESQLDDLHHEPLSPVQDGSSDDSPADFNERTEGLHEEVTPTDVPQQSEPQNEVEEEAEAPVSALVESTESSHAAVSARTVATVQEEPKQVEVAPEPLRSDDAIQVSKESSSPPDATSDSISTPIPAEASVKADIIASTTSTTTSVKADIITSTAPTTTQVNEVVSTVIDQVVDAKQSAAAPEESPASPKVQDNGPSVLFTTIEKYASKPEQSHPHHVWSLPNASKAHRYQCRHVVVKTIRVLYPSLFL